MKIFYPYNEILPKQKAHDVFIFQECSNLAAQGADVTLICGQGSEDEDLFAHYNVAVRFSIKRLPLIRKNNLFNLSWNFPFFWRCQREIERNKPDVVILSVLKPAAYHLARKVRGVKYLYEVHELAAYPGMPYDRKKMEFEKTMLQRADLIVVTTCALKEILQSSPYNVSTPIEVVPLAVHASPLEKSSSNPSFTLFYVGQLYEGQGVADLIRALDHVPEMILKVVGGKEKEIAALRHLALEIGVEGRVTFCGYHKPSELQKLLTEADGFVAPFQLTGRMPYVAHTKLTEYAAWGRPIVAPDVPAVREHFPEGKGAVLYAPGELATALKTLMKEHPRLQHEITTHHSDYSWEKRAKRYCELFLSKLDTFNK